MSMVALGWVSQLTGWVRSGNRCKNVFTFFYFGHVFTFLIFQAFFLFFKKRWQSSERQAD